MISEQKIYEAWKKRFSYPESSIEHLAQASLGKIKSLKAIPESKLIEKMKAHQVIVVGDDASSLEHQRMIQHLFGPSQNKTLWITSRPVSQIKLLKKNKMNVVRAVGKNVAQENKAILKSLKNNAVQYDRIIIWTGHLRVSMLPFQQMFKGFDPLFISLQANQLRWNFPRMSGWAIASDQFVVHLDTSALITVDQLRAQDEKISILSASELKSSFAQIMELIAKLLNQKKYILPKHIVSVFDSQDISFSKIKLEPSIRMFLYERMLLGESAVLPIQKTVLLTTLNPSHVAEEAAHQLRTGHRKNIYFGKSSVVVEEALAFFASRLLFPERPIPSLNQKMTDWDEVHMAGYALGKQLWKVWKRSAKTQNLIRKLWILYPSSELEYEMMLSVMLDLK